MAAGRMSHADDEQAVRLGMNSLEIITRVYVLHCSLTIINDPHS